MNKVTRIACCILFLSPIGTCLSQEWTPEGDVAEIGRLVTAYVRGTKVIRKLEFRNVEVAHKGDVRSAAVTMQWQYGRRKTVVESTVSLSMIHRPGLRRIFELNYRDSRGPVKHPECLLRLRDHLNELLETQDRVATPVINSEGILRWPGYDFVGQSPRDY